MEPTNINLKLGIKKEFELRVKGWDCPIQALEGLRPKSVDPTMKMSTFEKANNVKSDEELSENIRAEDKDEKKIREEVSEDSIIELEGKMKNQIVKDEEEYMSTCDSITEFEETWEMMLAIYNIEEHKWLKNLYNIRHMWSTTFNNDVFGVGLKVISRSESTNHALNWLGHLSTYLHIFVTNYEKNVVNKWRLSEEHEDFNSKQGGPTFTVKDSPILAQVSTITHKIYNIFERVSQRSWGIFY
ncbi:hypothetical protein RND71_001296 [Anisodus tanguticus]|uniref:Protein FAR1-RELATED SEQUENCE n=1 Tax=Anisodus tanguticus TaxID=243964 RepID=A0AAE1VY23_9SOLA|nr:hypothetical protein RND71_001296 [Anisodus tanguticus]